MQTVALKHVFLFCAMLGWAAMPAGPLRAAELNTTSTLTDEIPRQTIPNSAPRFTKVIDDLPLMPGLELMPDEDVLFIAPRSGRIAETTAEGMVDIDGVYKFYYRTLPHLGWRCLDMRTYQRENDVLRIDAHANEKVTTVRFSIKPAGEK